eukprot:COSAG02_NODE_81_length_39811_cov_51.728898_28_plen_168_part_00
MPPPPPPSRPTHRPARALPTELSVSNDTVPDDACAVLAFPASTPSTRNHQSAVPTPHHTTHHHSRSTAEQQRELWPAAAAAAAVDQDVRFLTAAPAIRDPFGFPHHPPRAPHCSLLTALQAPPASSLKQHSAYYNTGLRYPDRPRGPGRLLCAAAAAATPASDHSSS